MSKNEAQRVEDKAGEPIREGDEVWTKMRGGKHEGKVRIDQDGYKGPCAERRTQVEKVVTTQEEAEEEGVKNPPKVRLRNKLKIPADERVQVLFKDQHGHSVAHNPGTLQHTGNT